MVVCSSSTVYSGLGGNVFVGDEIRGYCSPGELRYSGLTGT